MQPFPPQDDDRKQRIIDRIIALMKADSTGTAATEAAEWIDFVLADLQERGRWWFLNNVATAQIGTGDDLIDLKGDIDRVVTVFCPKRLTNRPLSSIVEKRTIAINHNYANAGEVNSYALEAGRRVHLWPAPADAVQFAVHYQRPLAVEIVPGKFWEMMILNGVIAYFAQHFDRDALTQNISAFEARYEKQIRMAKKESHDIEVATRYDDMAPAGSTVTVDSTTEATPTDFVSPASLTGIGNECVYILTV